jgi:hypothetical protein
MTWKKCTAPAIAVGAALFLSAVAPVSATSPGLTAATMAGIAVQQAGDSLIETGHHGRHGYRRHGGYGRHGWYGRHGYRRHHRHHDGIGLALPLLAVPLIIESQRQDHGYDDDGEGDDEGLACYRKCRDYDGPDYCRQNYRKYC